MPVDRNVRTLALRRFALGALLASALALGGCSSTIAQFTSEGGSHPNEPAGYLPVEDMPPARDQAAIPLNEQTKIKKELLEARDRQTSAAGGQSQTQGQAQAQGKTEGKTQGSSQPKGQKQNQSASQSQDLNQNSR
jgi:hypothetical protein